MFEILQYEGPHVVGTNFGKQVLPERGRAFDHRRRRRQQQLSLAFVEG